MSEMKTDWKENLVGYRSTLVSVNDSGEKVIVGWSKMPPPDTLLDISWHIRYNTTKPIEHMLVK